MQALEFRLSIPQFLLSKGLSTLWPRRFLSWASCLHHCQIPIPKLPTPDWVRVKIEGCGICGSDLNTLRGHESYSMEPYSSFPAVMGHEIVGHLDDDTRVVVENTLPCCTRGIDPPCPHCAAGDYNLCEQYREGTIPPGVCIGFTKGLGGGFSEYVVAHKFQIFKIPDALPLRHAVLIDSLASALQPVATHLPDNAQTVLVYGAGIIGLNAIQCLRAAGFTGTILAVSRHKFQADWAQKLGATHIIGRDFYNDVAHHTGAKVLKPMLGQPILEGGVDIVFDCVGSSQTIDASLRVTKKRGKVVVVGTASTLRGVDASALWFKEVTLTGSAMFGTTTVNGLRQRTYQHVIDMLADNRLQAAGLVTHSFSLSEYAQAFQTALHKTRHQSLKVMLTPGS